MFKKYQINKIRIVLYMTKLLLVTTMDFKKKCTNGYPQIKSVMGRKWIL